MEDRIIELEKKLAFQEKAIEDHNEALIENQKKINELEQQMKFLGDKITKEDFVKKIEDEELPPHY